MENKKNDVIDIKDIEKNEPCYILKGTYGTININMQSTHLVAQKCPVCNGTGYVPYGFYTQNLQGQWTTSATGHETCRSCHGLGYVVV